MSLMFSSGAEDLAFIVDEDQVEEAGIFCFVEVRCQG